MAELLLRKVLSKTVCVSTDFPERRVAVAKSSQNLTSYMMIAHADIYKSNIIEHYTFCPNTIPAVDNLYLAEFAAYYYKEYKTDCINDAQPQILTEDASELHVQLSTNSGVTSQ